ncbi:MAG: ribosome maturation factor RimP [Erysipelotrichales bacterium]|nr:ribosome maturation factor RimP [Erysipelotrichales bacterium]
MPVIDEVRELIEPSLNEMNVSIFEITYGKEGKDRVLRILVEKKDETNISLDEIVQVSEKISLLLDEKDLISDDNYMLDVASAGAEHPIRLNELDKYQSKYINVHLINALDGENTYEGTLLEVNDENILLSIRIKTRTKNITIEKSNVDRARLAIKF